MPASPDWRFTGERLLPGNRLLRPMRVENLARFRFFAQRASGRHVLDLGCGAGEGTAFLAQQSAWCVVGVDLSTIALRVAAQEYSHTAAHFARADVYYLGFGPGQFGAVISVEVLEHLEDPNRYLIEVTRVLERGGVFMLTTPNRLRSSLTPGSLWPEHVREYSPSELRTLLERYFPEVELWGEYIPIYESHPLRRAMRLLAPYFKPWLPRWLRVRALPALQLAIREDLDLEDVHFTRARIEESPTLVAICR